MVDRLRVQAAGLDLAQLEGHLPACQLKTLRDLQRADEIHLRPLREALEAFHHVHRSQARATVWWVARNLSTVFRWHCLRHHNRLSWRNRQAQEQLALPDFDQAA